MLLEFLLVVVSCWDETQCVRNVHKLCTCKQYTCCWVWLPHFDFHLRTIFFTRCKFCENGFFNAFFPLSDTCHFETHPSPLSKIWGNSFMVCTFYSSTAKMTTLTPILYFMISIRTVLPFNEKKFSFLAILLCMDWAITGRIVCVQIKATLEA